jgi:hypothetical protein
MKQLDFPKACICEIAPWISIMCKNDGHVNLDECGLDRRLYREHGRAPHGKRIHLAVAGKRQQSISLLAASQQGKLVAPLVFQGSCTTEV